MFILACPSSSILRKRNDDNDCKKQYRFTFLSCLQTLQCFCGFEKQLLHKVVVAQPFTTELILPWVRRGAVVQLCSIMAIFNTPSNLHIHYIFMPFFHWPTLQYQLQLMLLQSVLRFDTNERLMLPLCHWAQ